MMVIFGSGIEHGRALATTILRVDLVFVSSFVGPSANDESEFGRFWVLVGLFGISIGLFHALFGKVIDICGILFVVEIAEMNGDFVDLNLGVNTAAFFT